jgi:hypothetical protein
MLELSMLSVTAAAPLFAQQPAAVCVVVWQEPTVALSFLSTILRIAGWLTLVWLKVWLLLLLGACSPEALYISQVQCQCSWPWFATGIKQGTNVIPL